MISRIKIFRLSRYRNELEQSVNQFLEYLYKSHIQVENVTISASSDGDYWEETIMVHYKYIPELGEISYENNSE